MRRSITRSVAGERDAGNELEIEAELAPVDAGAHELAAARAMQLQRSRAGRVVCSWRHGSSACFVAERAERARGAIAAGELDVDDIAGFADVPRQVDRARGHDR